MVKWHNSEIICSNTTQRGWDASPSYPAMFCLYPSLIHLGRGRRCWIKFLFLIKTNRTTVQSEIRKQTVDLEMSWIRIALKLRFCFLDFRAKYSHLLSLLTNCKDLLVMHDAKRRIFVIWFRKVLKTAYVTKCTMFESCSSNSWKNVLDF